MFWISFSWKENLIISKISGGIGNQLFQYAFGLVLAQKFSIKYGLHTEQASQNRIFRLSDLDISAKLYLDDKIKRSERGVILNRFLFPNLEFTVIKETSFAYTPVDEIPRSNIYLDGYWQSWKYFKDVKEQLINNEFRLLQPLSSNLKSYINIINNNETVALHVRRGDYLKKLHVHGVCDLDYYQNGVEVMVNATKATHLLIFSDDINWVRNNLHLDTNLTITLVENDPVVTELEYLMLMSLCQHQIIANSSFSWWAAYLNRNPKKVVIAPKKWFADPVLNAQTGDLIPPQWIKI